MLRAFVATMVILLVCCGSVAAQVLAPEVDFLVPPDRGATAGQISFVVEFKNGPGAAKIDVRLYTSRTCLGLQVPVFLRSTSGDVGLPSGTWADNPAALPRGVTITHAIINFRNKAGVVIASMMVDGLEVVVP